MPYDERLRVLVPWLQQLQMESLGKSHGINGERLKGRTGMLVWGSNGNEAQHSFYQWLRDGTGSTSIDLIWSEMPGHRYAEHYRVLLANARAQAEALVARDPKAPYFNAVSTIVLDAVTPRRLGAVMAMYEHKTTMLARYITSIRLISPVLNLANGSQSLQKPALILRSCLRKLASEEDPHHQVLFDGGYHSRASCCP